MKNEELIKQLMLAIDVENGAVPLTEVESTGRLMENWQPEPNRPEEWRHTQCRYRRKPSPRKVPIGPEDIKPGMVFNTIPVAPNVGFTVPVRVGLDGILFVRNNRSAEVIQWEHLQKFWSWSTDGETWAPCEKDEVGK